MAVYRGERTGNFTIMGNGHLRDRALSLKAKGLLSLMLSLPEGWSYSVRGLAAICREGVEAVTSALRELEGRGYVVRRRTREASGRIGPTEYVIREVPDGEQAAPEVPDREPPAAGAPEGEGPHMENPDVEEPYPGNPYTENPDAENPYTENPDTEKPYPGNTAQIKTKQTKMKEKKTEGSWIGSHPTRAAPGGLDGMEPEEPLEVRRQVLENIEYQRLCRQYPARREELDGLAALIVETLCARRRVTRVAGADFPHQVVQDRFWQLDSTHVEYVLESLGRNTTRVRNVKQYLLAALFNAPATMESYYAARVNHDLSRGGPGG